MMPAMHKDFTLKRNSFTDFFNSADLSIQKIDLPCDHINKEGIDGDEDSLENSIIPDTPSATAATPNGIQKIPSLVVQPNFLPQHC